MMKRFLGFTLIEMLIAIAIGAGIAAMAYRALSGAILAEEKISKVTQEVDEVDRVWQYMGRDLLYAVPRLWKDRNGAPKSALIGVQGDRLSQSDVIVPGEDDYILQFVRTNRENYLNKPRSNLYMVGYRLTQEEDNQFKTIWRDTWAPVDGSEEPVVKKRRLLSGIKTLGFVYHPAKFDKLTPESGETGWNYLASQPSAVLPAAIHVTMELDSMGELTRLFALTAVE